MKNRTLAVLVVVVVVLAVGAFVVLQADGQGSMVDWFRSLHGDGH